MCNGNKKCKKCQATKIGTMKTRRKSRVNGIALKGLNIERAATLGAGALASKLSTTLIAKVLKPTGDAKKDRNRGLMVAGAKVAAAMYGATQTKDQKVKDFLLGVIAEGALSAMPYLLKDTKNPFAAGEKIGATMLPDPLFLSTNMEEVQGVAGYYDDSNASAVAGYYDDSNSSAVAGYQAMAADTDAIFLV